MSYDSLTAIANRHDFEKTLTVEYDNDQNGLIILTPTTGKTLKIVGASIATEANSGYVRLYFSDDENDQVNTVLTIFPATVPASGYVPMIIRGDQNATLKIISTLGAGQNYFVLVNYEEE